MKIENSELQNRVDANSFPSLLVPNNVGAAGLSIWKLMLRGDDLSNSIELHKECCTDGEGWWYQLH